MKAQYFRYLSIIWLAAITFASLISARSISSVGMINIPGFDKFVHFVMYMLLCFLLLKSIKGKNMQVLALCICYGILMEMLQFLISTGRSFDFFDIIANIIGANVGALLATRILNK